MKTSLYTDIGNSICIAKPGPPDTKHNRRKAPVCPDQCTSTRMHNSPRTSAQRALRKVQCTENHDRSISTRPLWPSEPRLAGPGNVRNTSRSRASHLWPSPSGPFHPFPEHRSLWCGPHRRASRYTRRIHGVHDDAVTNARSLPHNDGARQNNTRKHRRANEATDAVEH